jgi:hypothetical protein
MNSPAFRNTTWDIRKLKTSETQKTNIADPTAQTVSFIEQAYNAVHNNTNCTCVVCQNKDARSLGRQVVDYLNEV